MYVTHQNTQAKENAVIQEAALDDLKLADKSRRFVFRWMAERGKEVYKLLLQRTGEILGLMAIEDVPDEIRIDINVLEVSKENVGNDKIYNGVAGCLIAQACRIAFIRGYSGFVSLTPKTVLLEHYKNAYGFEKMGRKLYSADSNSEALIEKYLEGK